MKMRALSNATCLRAIDGDTILCRMECPCCKVVSQQRVRLARIDAPELKGEHRGQALQSKAWLHDLIGGKEIKLAVVRQWPDKYGRVLAEVIYEGVNVSDCSLTAEMSYPYKLRDQLTKYPIE